MKQATWSVSSFVGPLIFLIYVNDIQNLVNNSTINLLADDTNIFISRKNINCIIKYVEDLANLENWFKVKKLRVNDSKSNFMVIQEKTQRKL